MLESVDKTLLHTKMIDFYKIPSIYHSNTTLYGGGGKLGKEKCEKSAIHSNNFGSHCSTGPVDQFRKNREVMTSKWEAGNLD